MALPEGTVTFLFTDLERSTRLWEDHPEAMKDALARHDAMLQRAVLEHDGHIVKSTGDGVHAAFASAPQAVNAALTAQLELQAESWGVAGPLRVRMGLHTGDSEHRSGDYYGSVVNRAARLMAAAHAGQILVSQATAALARDGLSPVTDLVDLGELELRDLRRPEQVFQVVHPELPREFPPLRAAQQVPGNLPVPVTSFLGRERELELVAEALADHRVVVLTGLGGVGKTRLAMQAAVDAAPHFADGAWWCELAGTREPAAVPDVVAASLRLQTDGSIPAVDMLTDFLAGRQLLLVLDNCEHLLDAAAHLVLEIEHRCPRVTVLATSREGLGAEGERILSVPSLETPAEGVPPNAVAGYEAVRLFVERARAAHAQFAISDANASHVAELCRRLDGVPLAIELAAARVQTFTPAEITRRLDQRFRILTGSRRSASERHQTLRGAIDWSYDLLAEEERRVFRYLGVFVGDFTLEAAEAVAAGDDTDADEVWDVLGHLVACSLVEAESDEVDTRYRLLETIRQYALERLTEFAETDDARAKHAHHYLAFIRREVPGLVTADEVEATLRIDRELDNIKAALEWAIDAGDLDVALGFVGVCDDVPPWCTGFQDMVQPLARLATEMPGAPDHPGYPLALSITAWFVFTGGDPALAERLANDALAAEARLGTEPPLSLPAVVYANIALLVRGDQREALEWWERGYELEGAAGRGIAAPLLAFAAISRAQIGDRQEAIAEAERALSLARRSGSPSFVGIALAAAGFTLTESDPARALALAREAIDIGDSLGQHGGGMSFSIAGQVVRHVGSEREHMELCRKTIDQMSWSTNLAALYGTFGRAADLLARTAPEVAAVLDGAVDQQGGRFSMEATEPEHLRAVAALAEAFDDARRAELRARGAAMTTSEAVAYARAAIDAYLAE